MKDRLPEAPEDSLAERLERAVRGARELSEAIWDCLQEELPGPDRERVRELAKRLADVSATVALLLDSTPTPAAGIRSDAGSDDPPVAYSERRTPPDPVSAPPDSPAGSMAGARLVDEQESAATITPFVAPSTAARSTQSSTAPGNTEIEIRDVRREEGPSAWITSVGRMLARHDVDRLPFAVLLVEIVDVAHLERSETPHDLHGIVAQVESALGRGMRASDELSRETLGRYWLLAPETNSTGARMLAERLASLVRGSATHRGVPMEVAIGIAICPEDGIDAPALAARADLGVYSARATGRSIVHTAPPH